MGGAKKTDGTTVYAEGESFKTGSSSRQERLEAFVDWLLTPTSERNPRTKKAFAEQWGVTTETVRKDARDPFVQRELVSRARAVAKVERLPEIMDSLFNITQGKNADGEVKFNRFGERVFPAPAASVSAANTILNWMEQTAGIREADVNVQDLSSEQLVEMALRFLNEADATGK